MLSAPGSSFLYYSINKVIERFQPLVAFSLAGKRNPLRGKECRESKADVLKESVKRPCHHVQIAVIDAKVKHRSRHHLESQRGHLIFNADGSGLFREIRPSPNLLLHNLSNDWDDSREPRVGECGLNQLSLLAPIVTL